VSDSGPSEAESSRPTDTLLAAYAAGTLSEPFAVLVASHLQMRADSRAGARGQAHGAAIFRHARRPQPQPPAPAPSLDRIDAFMPLALRSYVGRHQGVLEWRTLLPGLERCRITRDAGAEASFLHCRPGGAIPAHTHHGREAVLVLQGGFRDQGGHYVPGDIAVADGTVDHRPVADRSAACLIFVALEAPVRLTGPFGRLVQRIFGAV
jgi:putative transcriptional regulator